MTDHIALSLAAAALLLTSFSTVLLLAWRGAQRRVLRSLVDALGRFTAAVDAVAHALDRLGDESRLTSLVEELGNVEDIDRALRHLAEAAMGVTRAHGALVAVEGSDGERRVGSAGDMRAADPTVGWPLDRAQAMTFATLPRADHGVRSTVYGAAVPIGDTSRSIGLLTAFFDSNEAAAHGLAVLERVAAAAAPLLEAALSAEAAADHEPDVVTHLPTRAAFHQAIVRESARARRDGSPLSVVIVDVDGFRTVNETGPLTADQVLVGIAETIEQLRPPESLLYRVGGDAFGLVLPGRTGEEAHEIVARLGPVQLAQGPTSVHLSTGIAELQPTEDGTTLAAKAQAALDETKQARLRPADEGG